MIVPCFGREYITFHPNGDYREAGGETKRQPESLAQERSERGLRGSWPRRVLPMATFRSGGSTTHD